MTNPLARDLDHVLEHTRAVWEALRGARILVTGGTGFFGCWLLESFAWACDRLELGAFMAVVTRSAAAFRDKAPRLARHPAIELIEGDIRSFRLHHPRFSHVIHAATASAAFGREQPVAAFDAMVDGARRVLDVAVSAGARRFLFTSSGAVYGTQPPELRRLPENYAGAPNPFDTGAVYGEGKRIGELLAAAYAQQYGLQCLIARGFAFVGPYLPLDGGFAIGNFIRDRLAGRPIEVRDGRPYRSYLYAADLAIWLWTILTFGESCRPYNVGSEREITIAELAQTVDAVLSSEPGVPCSADGISALPTESPLHNDGDGLLAPRYVPSTERARRELGLAEWIDLPEAIRRTAEWHSSFIEANS